MGIRWWIAALGVLSFSCGDGDGDSHDRPDAGSGSEADAAPADAGAGDIDAGAGDIDAGAGDIDAGHGNDGGVEHADGAPDGDAGSGPTDAGLEPDAGQSGPRIDSIVVDGAFSQIHMGDEFLIQIFGARLEGVTDIVIANTFRLDPSSFVVTPTEVRAVLFMESRVPLGPRDVTVTGTGGSATIPDAIELTPWIFDPNASPGGRGTYESPILLADYENGSEEAFGGPVIFRVGGHVGDPDRVAVFTEDVAITGEAGADFTIVRGGIQISSSSGTASLRDLTLEGDFFWSADQGELVVERVRMLDGTATVTGLSREGQGPPVTARFKEVTYIGRDVPATRVGIQSERLIRVTVSNSRFSGCGTAMAAGGDSFTVENTTIEGCAVGLRSGTPFGVRSPSVSVTNCELVDNRIGISIPVGTATVTATSISDNEATEAASDHGISIGDAVFVATDVTITGQDIAGFNAHGVGGEPESRMAVDLADMVIEGGQRGVRLGGFVDDGHFAMHSSEVSGQTVSAVDIGLFDLAYVDLTGGNRLSVVSGFALEDTRFDPNFVFIEARGILLNGRTYTGLVEGTASVPPDYRIIARNGGIQF